MIWYCRLILTHKLVCHWCWLWKLYFRLNSSVAFLTFDSITTVNYVYNIRLYPTKVKVSDRNTYSNVLLFLAGFLFLSYWIPGKFIDPVNIDIFIFFLDYFLYSVYSIALNELNEMEIVNIDRFELRNFLFSVKKKSKEKIKSMLCDTHVYRKWWNGNVTEFRFHFGYFENEKKIEK